MTSSISVYIDTNCINAKQANKYLNELEELYIREEILIEKTDTLDTELQDGKGYPQGLKKSMKYIESYGPTVFDHSRWNSSILGDEKDEERLSKVLEILWGKKVRSSYRKQDIRDAMHISTAIRYGGKYFVTDERKLLNKADKIEIVFGIKIRNPENCLDEVKARLKVLEELEQ